MEGSEGYTLGIDLGTNSLGWAVVWQPPEGQPQLRLGARIFAAAFNLEKNREVSAAAPRRAARLARRQIERRARRLKRLFRYLQKVGLLPPGPSTESQQRDATIKELDRLIARTRRSAWPRIGELGPLVVRARALDERLEPHEVGRALFHLGQRRGYQKLRGAPASEDETGTGANPDNGEPMDGLRADGGRAKGRKPRSRKPGKVQAGITAISEAMERTGARTLGEYLSGLEPSRKTPEEDQRIRRRYVSRRQVQAEFTAIWNAQARHHPTIMTRDVRAAAWEAMFHQRPLKSPKRFVGTCALEGARTRRAALALLECQRFRMLQKVNDLRIADRSGSRTLTADERRRVLDHLDIHGDTALRELATKVLELPKGTTFNFEMISAGELVTELASPASKITGNRTAAKLIGAVGRDAWLAMTEAARTEAVDDVRTFNSAEALVRKWQRRIKLWRTAAPELTSDEQRSLTEMELESGYLGFSLKAIRKLLPIMECGVPLATAIQHVYPQRGRAHAPLDRLPPAREVFPTLRNPVVERALTELRKVVNALVAEHGKPRMIRVELARDLKRSAEDRDRMRQANNRRAMSRDRARARVREALGLGESVEVREWQVVRALLLDELPQPARCPYCGVRDLAPHVVFGDEGDVHVEHIVPFSRCLDDSFINKTLACSACNAAKGTKTPRELVDADAVRWGGLLERFERMRVDNWRPRWPGQENPKRRRAGMSTEDVEQLRAQFDSRQLNDTRHASRLAREYLALLFGGINDESGRQRVGVGSGQVTAFLRNAWDMNGILHDGPRKTRADHRHHAVDALMIALTTTRAIADLSAAAARAEGMGNRRAAIRRALRLEPPWPSLRADAEAGVRVIAVSHRVDRRIAGALHDATLYSADGTARRFAAKKADSLVAIGEGARRRLVRPNSNHHAVVFEHAEGRGGRSGRKGDWDFKVVSRLEAYRRRSRARLSAADQPSQIVERDLPADQRFLFSLCVGDTIRLTRWDGSPLAVVRSISRGALECMRIEDAREVSERRTKDKSDRNRFLFQSGRKLRDAGAVKVVVTPAGRIEVAHD